MLFPDCQKDRYCKFVFNPETASHERLWLRYADGTCEPVRRVGDPERKWAGSRLARAWWIVQKPADWLPWEHGFGFAWNHDLGQEGKPADWGGKSEAEARAGNAPYFLEVDADRKGRVVRRTERIDGRRETWRYRYDARGRLTSCFCADGWGRDYEYDGRGDRRADYATGRTPYMRVFRHDRRGGAVRLRAVDGVRYEYDGRGCRSVRRSPAGAARYHHLPDGRLALVELEDGRLVEYRHDERGRPEVRLVNGDPAGFYHWLDDGRLGAFGDGRIEWVFGYGPGGRLPRAAAMNGLEFTLAYDQAGSLKAVIDGRNRVVKAVQYDPFGVRLWDSNPVLRLPLGFAGGLDDPDTGLVRFGARSWDPDTGLWTAPDADGGGDEARVARAAAGRVAEAMEAAVWAGA
ncbi:MAG: hypothetical protein V3571_04640 [Pseudodesulfovibrio sp.]